MKPALAHLTEKVIIMALELSATYYPPRKEGRAGTVGFYVRDSETRQEFFGNPSMHVDDFACLFPGTIDILFKKGSHVFNNVHWDVY